MIGKLFNLVRDLFRLVGKHWRESRGLPLWERLKVVRNTIELRLAYARKQDLLVRRIHGYRMYLDINRAGIAYELAIWGQREELDNFIVRHEIKPGMSVLDIGANVGYYTLLIASQLEGEGQIVASEPFPANHHDLQRNIRLNDLDDLVEVLNLAFSNFEGETEFFVGRADNLGTLMDYSALTGEKADTIVVQTTTVDKLSQQYGYFDFLRMDIEGSECEVFDGLQANFEQGNFPRILFEVHPAGDIDPDPRFTPRFEKLLSVGYRPKYMTSSSNPDSPKRFAELGYKPIRFSKEGQALYEDIRPEHLVELGARRPKLVRSIYLIHQDDLAH